LDPLARHRCTLDRRPQPRVRRGAPDQRAAPLDRLRPCRASRHRRGVLTISPRVTFVGHYAQRRKRRWRAVRKFLFWALLVIALLSGLYHTIGGYHANAPVPPRGVLSAGVLRDDQQPKPLSAGHPGAGDRDGADALRLRAGGGNGPGNGDLRVLPGRSADSGG